MATFRFAWLLALSGFWEASGRQSLRSGRFYEIHVTKADIEAATADAIKGEKDLESEIHYSDSSEDEDDGEHDDESTEHVEDAGDHEGAENTETNQERNAEITSLTQKDKIDDNRDSSQNDEATSQVTTTVPPISETDIQNAERQATNGTMDKSTREEISREMLEFDRKHPAVNQQNERAFQAQVQAVYDELDQGDNEAEAEMEMRAKHPEWYEAQEEADEIKQKLADEAKEAKRRKDTQSNLFSLLGNLGADAVAATKQQKPSRTKLPSAAHRHVKRSFADKGDANSIGMPENLAATPTAVERPVHIASGTALQQVELSGAAQDTNSAALIGSLTALAKNGGNSIDIFSSLRALTQQAIGQAPAKASEVKAQAPQPQLVKKPSIGTRTVGPKNHESTAAAAVPANVDHLGVRVDEHSTEHTALRQKLSSKDKQVLPDSDKTGSAEQDPDVAAAERVAAQVDAEVSQELGI